MSISSMITRNCVQTAVYWAAPTEDGYGGKTYEEPIEIMCRWEDMNQVVSDNKGSMITSRAVVYVLQDLDEEGMLYLGTLDSLYDTVFDSSAGALNKPQDIVGAYSIKRFDKVPVLHSTTDFLRKAYLTPSLSFGGF
jgi:hypothetical protein